MQQLLSYLFWPRPPKPVGLYDNPKVLLLLGICAGLIVLSFALSYWRRRLKNPVTRKLSRSWASAAFWFGLSGLILVLARTEDVSFISMRFWWIAWGFAALVFLWFQGRQFRTRHYETLPRVRTEDPREKYLPKKR